MEDTVLLEVSRLVSIVNGPVYMRTTVSKGSIHFPHDLTPGHHVPNIKGP